MSPRGIPYAIQATISPLITPTILTEISRQCGATGQMPACCMLPVTNILQAETV
ncbi:MAG: hypothetical protein J5644_07570 [Bacteroidales bacterium]|nr:hypothetical protein [Bacteroidales bacterium]